MLNAGFQALKEENVSIHDTFAMNFEYALNVIKNEV